MKYPQLLLLSLLLIATHSVNAKSYYGLFGDVGVIEQKNLPLKQDSVSGVLDFYLAHEFNSRLSALLELVYDNSYVHTETDAERFSLKYNFIPEFNLAIGRFHTPLGNVNRTQHHGTFLQEMVTKPFFLEYHEPSSTLPLHVVGLMATGTFHKGSLNFSYESTLHSQQTVRQITSPGGQDFIEIDPNNSLSGSIDPGLSLRFRIFPDHRNWQVAAFAYQNKVGLDLNNIQNLLDESIVGLDVQYTYHDWELSAEYFRIRHDYQIANNDFDATAYYLQLGYRYSDKIGLHTRYAFMNIDENDPYYVLSGMNDQHRSSAAIRYELNDDQALKLELGYLDFEDQSIENVTSIEAQWSFLFH